MQIRKRPILARGNREETRTQDLTLGAGVKLATPRSKSAAMREPALAGVDWNYDTLGGLRYVPPSGWMQGEDAPQQPPQSAVPQTIQAWHVKPIVGNHWHPVYYRTPPDNLVTDASAHTGTPHISVTDGFYAKFMPPPVSLGVQHASRGEIPYSVPPTQDRGSPVFEGYRETQYNPWTGS